MGYSGKILFSSENPGSVKPLPIRISFQIYIFICAARGKIINSSPTWTQTVAGWQACRGDQERSSWRNKIIIVENFVSPSVVVMVMTVFASWWRRWRHWDALNAGGYVNAQVYSEIYHWETSVHSFSLLHIVQRFYLKINLMSFIWQQFLHTLTVWAIISKCFTLMPTLTFKQQRL